MSVVWRWRLRRGDGTNTCEVEVGVANRRDEALSWLKDDRRLKVAATAAPVNVLRSSVSSKLVVK